MARSPVFDNVDPGLLELIQRVSANYPQYLTNITSAYRAGDPRFHGRGQALDVELVDPKTGQVLNNYQDASTAAQYQALANAVYQAASPEMQQKLRWGGYFGGGKGKYGALDLMHFDVGGGPQGVGMAGGSWAGGFTPEMMNTWGIQNAGGLGGGAQQMGPPMPAAQMNYTPEQRRQAIAAIESAGSGDYNALGVWTGDPKDGRDRAYGRYQIMGKNIPAWSKEVLGREVTPEEFMRDPKIQDAIFDKKFGDYVAKHGERGAASMWFTGSPNFDADKKDALGTTVKSYATRYLEGLGAPLDVGAKYPTQSPAQSPAQSPGAPAVAGATTEKPKDPYASGFADISKSIGGMLGGGTAGGSGQLPIARAPAPMSTMMEAQPNNILDPQAGEMQRQKLAMAMARLNSGKLWV